MQRPRLDSVAFWSAVIVAALLGTLVIASCSRHRSASASAVDDRLRWDQGPWGVKNLRDRFRARQ